MGHDEDASTTDSAGAISVDHHPPEEVFGILGNATRLRILQSLGEAEDDTLSFSALQDRADVDDSGQFNYHLGKLTGRFVRKDGSGYGLTLAGNQLVGALLAGTYTATAETVDPLPVDAPCPECGGEVVASYAEETATTHCLDCEDWYNQVSFPPGVLDQFDSTELPRAFDRWLWTVLERTHAGFCHNCAGRVSGHLVREPDHAQGVTVEYPCDRCGETATVSALLPVLLDPAGTCLLHEEDIDLRKLPLWELNAHVEETVEILAEDPLTVRVTIQPGDRRLTATIEADLTLRDLQVEGN
jgi:DNA-binding transcriptional ArsR family regulator